MYNREYLLGLASLGIGIQNLGENQQQSNNQEEILRKLDHKLDNQDELYLKKIIEQNELIIEQNELIINLLKGR